MLAEQAAKSRTSEKYLRTFALIAPFTLGSPGVRKYDID
jgi:hypothetical protein